MKQNLIFTVTIGILAGLLSCQKKDATPAQPGEVSININLPEPNQKFKKGDTVHISGNISYISQMHGYIVRLYNDSTNTLIFEDEGHSHGDKIDVDAQWVDTLNVKAKLRLELIGVIDHDENEKSAYINIYSQP